MTYTADDFKKAATSLNEEANGYAVISRSERARKLMELCRTHAAMLRQAADQAEELARLRAETPADNPEFDGTDGAHPAWWRGNDAGFTSGMNCLERWLIEPEIKGVYGSAKANALRERVHELRAKAQPLVKVAGVS